MKLFKAEEFKDERGIILNGSPNNPEIRNVMYITGTKDSIRGNHVHKKDSHYCMCVEGEIRYEWFAPGMAHTESLLLHEGDIVLSEPGEMHRFVFESDGAFVAMATEPRTQELYETDTIRTNEF